MINKLKKQLVCIFICVTMLIFTVVFCLLLHNNIVSVKENDRNFFSREVTYLIFQLEETTISEQTLVNCESDGFLLSLMDRFGNIIYQSSALQEIPELPEALSEELKKVASFSSEDITKEDIMTEDITTDQSAAFFFSSPTGISHYGIQAHVTTREGDRYTLDIFREAPSFLEILGKSSHLYLLAWILVLTAVALLAFWLIGRALSPAEHAIKSQKEFVASASHELKSPLAVMMTLSECISSDPSLPQETRRQAQTMDLECIRMSRLIQDMLLLSSMDANTWKLKKSRVDVDTLLIHMFEKYEPVCRQKEQNFLFQINDNVFPEIEADADRLEQILGILIDNASHYSPEGSKIRLTAEIYPRQIVFSVIDHGPGIADKDKPYIYDRFFMVDKSRTERDHFGLGLCIAKELTEMHGGTIRLSDTPGGGCTFSVFLPLE